LFGGLIRERNGLQECSVDDRKEHLKRRAWQIVGGDIPKIANDSIMFASAGRRMLVCQKGYIGLGPKHTEVGDVVYVVRGSRVPYILRPVEHENRSDTFKFIGECYVHGIMNGEAIHGYSEDQKRSMSEWLQLKILGGRSPDPENGRKIFEWISLQ
jgi:hypothetical protein